MTKKEELNRLFGAYDIRLEKLYDKFIDRLVHLGYNLDELTEDVLFNFDNFPELTEELNKVFNDYVQEQMLCYKAGITDGVALAYSQNKGLLKGFSVLGDKALTNVRNNAANAFIRNRLKSPRGLSLSQLVWNYSQQSKSEFEVAISDVIADGLKSGTSAEELGRRVREYLNHPDMMYRRYHEKVIVNGQKKDVVTWRRRVIDENGKVRFIKTPLEEVGMGHYRSSRKNAVRLMRTEINSSYHFANYEFWQNEPYIIGIRISLSPQHPHEDICDDLAGDYPKDFKWANWHIQCLCTSDPITIKGKEKEEFYRRLSEGEDMSGYVSPNRVKDVPKRYRAYTREHHDEIFRAAKRGKLAWHYLDNTKYWANQFTPAELKQMGISQVKTKVPKKPVKTQAEKDDIQRRWDERREQIRILKKMKNNVMDVSLDYPEVDAFPLISKQFERSNNEYKLKLIKQIAKEISVIKKREHAMFSAEQHELFKEIEKRLKIKRQRPMSINEADKQNANPNYYKGEEYQINCQTCAPAYMLRLCGFDVWAKGNTPGSLSDWISYCHSFDIWMTKDKKPCTPTLYEDWMKKKGYKQMSKKRYEEFFEENCKEVGVYVTTIRWSRNRGAHATILQRLPNGKLVYIDPQVYSSSLGAMRDFRSLCENGAATDVGYRGVLRIDDKLFDVKYLSIFDK